MSNFKSTYATDNRVESTVHIISHYLRAATNRLGAKKAYTDYFVMTGDLVEELINSYQNRDAKSALVIDDVGLQVINRLVQEGVKDITLALARVPEENLETVKYIIHNTFTEFNIKIVSIEETKGMNVDLVIANPPYGKIGAEITKKIIDTVDFKEYINLLPANDYKRNDSKDLYNYQSDMRALDNYHGEVFADAAVTTHLAKIHKTKANNMTLEEFERSQYIDRSLDKYFEENSKRQSAVVDKYLPSRDLVKQIGPERSLIFTKRDVSHKHLPYSKKVNSYKWNVESSITADYLINNTAVDFNNSVSIEMLICTTRLEKTNQANFYYSKDGFKFISKLFTSVNVDSRIDLTKILPKVDWTRSWTVEEILKDYDYTEDEIKEVMEDLKNYKGMED